MYVYIYGVTCLYYSAAWFDKLVVWLGTLPGTRQILVFICRRVLHFLPDGHLTVKEEQQIKLKGETIMRKEEGEGGTDRKVNDFLVKKVVKLPWFSLGGDRGTQTRSAPLRGHWREMRCVYTMEYYSATKKRMKSCHLWYNMDEPRGYAKWNKSDKDKYHWSHLHVESKKQNEWAIIINQNA